MSVAKVHSSKRRFRVPAEPIAFVAAAQSASSQSRESLRASIEFGIRGSVIDSTHHSRPWRSDWVEMASPRVSYALRNSHVQRPLFFPMAQALDLTPVMLLLQMPQQWRSFQASTPRNWRSLGRQVQKTLFRQKNWCLAVHSQASDFVPVSYRRSLTDTSL